MSVPESPRPSKNPDQAYNLCSRFHRRNVYSCASPDGAKIPGARGTDKRCRPMHGQFHLRLANGPTREAGEWGESAVAESVRTRTPQRGAAWLGKNAA